MKRFLMLKQIKKVTVVSSMVQVQPHITASVSSYGVFLTGIKKTEHISR